MGGVLYQFDRNSRSVVLNIRTLVVSQSVDQCIAVDLFPHILANVVDIQKVHFFVAYTIVELKNTGYPL